MTETPRPPVLLTRYAIEWRYGGNYKWTESPSGDWVRAEDADAALQEARAERDRLKEEKHGAYDERDRLVCVLSKLWPSHLARHPEDDATWDDEWRWIVCVHTPVGQAAWHIKDSEREWFDHLPVRENDWDGHSTPEKYLRLATIEEPSR